MISLTKRSKQVLLNRFIGCGQLFVKTGNKEFEMVEFWLANKGTFYITGNNGKPQHLKDYLTVLASELKDRED